MIQSKLLEEIEQYCKANNIEDIEKFVNKMLRNGFNIERYGEKPPWFETKQEKEPIKVDEESGVIELPTELIKIEEEIYLSTPLEALPEEEKKEETSKTYNIDIKVNNDKQPDLYDEDNYQPKKGFLGSNIFNRRRNE